MMLLNQIWLNFIRITCISVGIGLVRTLSNLPSRTRCSTVSSGERMNTPHAPQLIWYNATSIITSNQVQPLITWNRLMMIQTAA